jgi:hypothetical protein
VPRKLRTEKSSPQDDFREFRTGEVRRIPLPRTWVNKGL